MAFAAFDPANDEDGLPITVREPRHRTLMRLDKDMEPASEMQRLLRRLERRVRPVREG